MQLRRRREASGARVWFCGCEHPVPGPDLLCRRPRCGGKPVMAAVLQAINEELPDALTAYNYPGTLWS